MPELPEVETVCAGLRSAACGRTIVSARCYRPNLRYPFPDQLEENLSGHVIHHVGRRAKYLLLHIGAFHYVAHLGMSGSYVVRPSGQRDRHKHDHLVMALDDGNELVYHDPRRFGFLLQHDTDDVLMHPMLAPLGVEPLSNACNGPYLEAKLQAKKAPIKQALLDQHIICGIGNIYACEVLYRSKIHPATPAYACAERSDVIVAHIVDILQEAIASGGSTLRNYANATGDTGYFQHHFAVYGKNGQACEQCGCVIARVKQSGRSSFYCPTCQPEA